MRLQRSTRRLSGAAFCAVIAAAATLALPGAASADTSASLTVVGTADASASGLIQNVIEPAFRSAYPQFSFHYVAASDATAIADAETGAGGASALLADTPSLENQFVAGGFSAEQYGRALWSSDLVLAGPSADPAGIAANASHNIAQAFADIAAAGIAGRAQFISPGGTSESAVQEHALWGLVAESGLAPSGLTLCAVSTANGGGQTPIAAGAGAANGQPCPGGGAPPSGSALPAWYAIAGAGAGENLVSANACSGYHSGAGSCYALADRGTYDYLASGQDPAGAIPQLAILTRDDAASAPGGADALTSAFHGYIVNPGTPGQTVNLPAAQDFLNLITSPAVQAQVAGYLASTGDAGGAPFTPDAAPSITLSSGLPAAYTASQPLTLAGTVANRQPGYPALAGVVVTVNQLAGGLTVPVATATTNAAGAFSMSFTPPARDRYTLSTPQFAQVEDATLSPPFGDILAPAATGPTYVNVRGALTGVSARSLGGRALVLGAVSPAGGHVKAAVALFARRAGAKRYRRVASTRLATGDGRFAVEAKLGRGRWQLQTTFNDPKAVLAATPRISRVRIGAAPTGNRIATHGVSLSRGGRLVAHVALSRGAARRATVRLEVVALNGSGRARARKAGRVHLRAGATRATLRTQLTGAGHWAVLAVYSAPHQAAVWTTRIVWVASTSLG